MTTRKNGNGRRPGPITKRHRDAYLAALRLGSTHEAAAQAAGKSRAGFKDLRQRDEAFAVEVAEAADAGCEAVEQQLVKIAFGTIEAKSTAQVTACFGILRARRPEVWRENYREPDKPGRMRLDVSKLADEEVALLRGLLAKARG